MELPGPQDLRQRILRLANVDLLLNLWNLPPLCPALLFYPFDVWSQDDEKAMERDIRVSVLNAICTSCRPRVLVLATENATYGGMPWLERPDAIRIYP